MIQKQTNNQRTNAYEVTNHNNSWGNSIQSMVSQIKQFQSTQTPGKIAEECRGKFYREFWELCRQRAKSTLWTRGFTSCAHENAEDAASFALLDVLVQECAGDGVFQSTFSSEDHRRYLSGTVSKSVSKGVRAVLNGDKRACALSAVGTEALDGVIDPRHEEFDLKRLCMDVREVSMAIAPKYKGRLPDAGTTPLNEVLIKVCLKQVESDLAKRSYQRLQKDIREDLAEVAGVDIF